MHNGAVQLPLFEDALKQYQQTPVSERPARFMTTSSEPVERLYTPQDFAEHDYMDKVGFPGQWPYTRGVHATGYRGRLWTMRMFAGFGSAEETNERFKYLLAHGNDGLSVAFDMPTLYGYDTDDPKAEGEFGTCGVAVSSLADMEILFDGIPLDQITTSMTINSPAAMIWAMYLVNAEKRGFAWDTLSVATYSLETNEPYQSGRVFPESILEQLEIRLPQRVELPSLVSHLNRERILVHPDASHFAALFRDDAQRQIFRVASGRNLQHAFRQHRARIEDRLPE